MSAEQLGTGSLTAAGQATAAGVFMTVPTGAIVDSITTSPGGSPISEDVYDENGAFHTRFVYEREQTQATIVLVGVAYATAAGYEAKAGYYIESVSEEKTKSAVRTTIVITKL